MDDTNAGEHMDAAAVGRAQSRPDRRGRFRGFLRVRRVRNFPRILDRRPRPHGTRRCDAPPVVPRRYQRALPRCGAASAEDRNIRRNLRHRVRHRSDHRGIVLDHFWWGPYSPSMPPSSPHSCASPRPCSNRHSRCRLVRGRHLPVRLRRPARRGVRHGSAQRVAHILEPGGPDHLHTSAETDRDSVSRRRSVQGRLHLGDPDRPLLAPRVVRDRLPEHDLPPIGPRIHRAARRSRPSF